MFQFSDLEPTQSLMPKGLGTGHVFAVLQDRYIVDYWAWKNHQISKLVLDMKDPKDRSDVRKYGLNWEYLKN